MIQVICYNNSSVRKEEIIIVKRIKQELVIKYNSKSRIYHSQSMQHLRNTDRVPFLMTEMGFPILNHKANCINFGDVISDQNGRQIGSFTTKCTSLSLHTQTHLFAQNFTDIFEHKLVLRENQYTKALKRATKFSKSLKTFKNPVQHCMNIR